MFCVNNSENLFGLQGLEIKKIESDNENITVVARMKRKIHKCPVCGSETDKVHDYRKQVIRDTPAFNKNVIIILEKRRYACACGKHFIEKVPFLPRYHRMTNRLIQFILDKLRGTDSFTSVAHQANLSVSTIIRIFDFVSFSKPAMPRVLAVDEFKGNTGGEKYNCIITDPENHRVLDILPKRYDYYLSTYFKSCEDRDNVQIFISDMWKPYYETAGTYFKNANRVVDKYHWIRQVVWAFERVRKDVQKQFQKSHRVYFKRSRNLLLKHNSSLSDDEKTQVSVMIGISPTLSTAYFLKERFYKLINCKTRKAAKQMLIDWIDSAENSKITAFEKCAKTMQNWFTAILNSFDTQYTNGFTEGCNNKIKVLKRNAFGYRNFNRFRKRILFAFST